MDDIDERIAFRRMTDPLIRHLDLDDGERDLVREEMWQERAALGRWLLLLDDTDARAGLAAGRRGGH